MRPIKSKIDSPRNVKEGYNVPKKQNNRISTIFIITIILSINVYLKFIQMKWKRRNNILS